MFEIIKKALNKKTLQNEEATASIAGVRDFYSSYPSNGLTPIKLARILKESAEGDILAYLELAEEMEEKELQYSTVLSTRKRTVSQLDITVESSGDSPKEQAHVDFIRDFIKRDTLETELFDMLDAIGKGFSVTEIVWETSENQWLPKKLCWVDPRWIEFKQNDLRKPLLKTAEGLQELTPYKYIYTTIKAKSGLDIRGGLARSIAWAYLFKNYSLKDWVSFLEVYGHPFRVGKYGKSATPEDKRKLLQAVYTIGADAAAIIPQEMMIEFLKTETNAGGDAFKVHAEYLDHMISKNVLGQTTTTDAISGGHAVSKEHNDVRMDIAKSDAKQLAAVLNRDLIEPIINLNFGKQKNYPRLIIGSPEPEDVAGLVNSVSKLMPYGFTTSKKQLLSKLGLNPPEDESDVFGSISFQPQAVALNKPLSIVKNDLIDDLGDEELADWQPKIEPLKEKIEDLIRRLILEGKGLEDLKAELVKLEISPDNLVESLAQSSMAARLMGEKND